MAKTKAGNFLKPRWINILLTLFVLALPILREKVLLEDGGYIIDRYSPLVLVGSYVWLKDWYPFLMMLGFSLFIYIVTSATITLFDKLFKVWKKKFLT